MATPFLWSPIANPTCTFSTKVTAPSV
jgi:hypothetical protein